MITRFSVKAFKSLLEIDIDLGKVNVLIGANGSGKSNLLEAIGVLGAAASGRVDDESLLRRGVRPGVPALYKASFAESRMRGSIRLEAASSGAQYSVEINNPLHDPQPAWAYGHELLKEGQEKLFGRSPASNDRLDPQRGLAALKAVELAPDRDSSKLLANLAAYCIYSPATEALRGLIPDRQTRDPVGLAGGRLPEAVQELLRRHSDDPVTREAARDAMELIDWAQAFGSGRPGDLPLSPSVAATQRVLYFKDRFMAKDRDLLTGYDASEGALYILFAAVVATLPSAPIFYAIDNFDHALNPRLARALMSRMCAWILGGSAKRQVLLTVHNPLVLDGLPLEDDDVRLFAVERTRKGRTVVRRVVVDISDLKRDGELWTVSRLWVMGHLGAMPDV